MVEGGKRCTASAAMEILWRSIFGEFSFEPTGWLLPYLSNLHSIPLA